MTSLSSPASSSSSFAPTAAPAPAPTEPAELDRLIERVAGNARRFARTSARDKAALLGDVRARFYELAPRMVELACRAHGIEPDSTIAGEQWFSGPAVSLRALRLFQRSLEDLAGGGTPRLPEPFGRSPDERLTVPMLPFDDYDRALFLGFRCDTWLESGVTARRVREEQARFYRASPGEGHVALVLGAGNVASISVLDVLYHSFVEGGVCLLKMNPVNAYLGPLYEQAFAPLTERGFLAFVYGGAETGARLVEHAGVDTVHLTGSVDTHDRIVWGPPGEERERLKREGRPLLRKPVTSELGNVTPALVVPAHYTDRELDRVARAVAGMVINNASFNCIALKLLVTAREWPQREELLARIERALAAEPTRVAYYPGAADRYQRLVRSADPDSVSAFGEASLGHLPWTLIRDVDPEARSPLFEVEPFCSLLSETAIGAESAAEFLAAGVRFVNERVFGTLNALLFVPDSVRGDIEAARALDRALVELHYGTVGVNVWPGVGYGLGSPVWGGAPGATLADAQSGLGWGHNSAMLEHVHKVVLQSPLLSFPEPLWMQGHRQLLDLGRAFSAQEAEPSLLRAGRAAWAGVRA